MGGGYGRAAGGAKLEAHTPLAAMSQEQLSALLAKLKDDARLRQTSLREKLMGAADPDAAVAMAQEAGFDVSKDDWLRNGEEMYEVLYEGFWRDTGETVDWDLPAEEMN
jgi:predicted ribosomally synthesized peptide with nif11-like leader